MSLNAGPCANTNRARSVIRFADVEVSGLGLVPGVSLLWSAEEQAILEQGLREYASESVINRYAKIAGKILGKTIRDVALRYNWMKTTMFLNTSPCGNSNRAHSGSGASRDAVDAAKCNTKRDVSDLKSNHNFSMHWSAEEQAVLEHGLIRYASEPTLVLYAGIAAWLPHKTILDVALRHRRMIVKSGRCANSIGAHSGSVRDAAKPNKNVPSKVPGLLLNPEVSLHWSVEEQAILDRGLLEDAPASSMARVAKVAALLPDKTMHDVALRHQWMKALEASPCANSDQAHSGSFEDAGELANNNAARNVSGLLLNPEVSLHWSADEQFLLERGLLIYASEPSMARCAKIAMLLPDKTMHDVALRQQWMTASISLIAGPCANSNVEPANGSAASEVFDMNLNPESSLHLPVEEPAILEPAILERGLLEEERETGGTTTKPRTTN